jgi:hypothetical protein
MTFKSQTFKEFIIDAEFEKNSKDIWFLTTN